MTRWLAIEALEELAATQFGVFTEEQAFYENVSKDMVARHSRPGCRWRRIAPRVYEVVGQTADWHRPLMAALLSLGPRAVASHRSAASVLGFDGVTPGVVELTVPIGRSRPDWVLHRRVTARDEIAETGPIRHTTPTRTLVDLAAVVDDLVWERALESALRKGLATIGDVETRGGGRGRKGAARIHRVLALRPPGTPPTGSELETRFVQLARESATVPRPERQVPVRSQGRVIASVDLAWPPVGLFVELDGVAFHDRPGALLYDRHRQNQIVTLLGWRPLRYTWDDVVRRPRATLRALEQAYARAVAG